MTLPTSVLRIALAVWVAALGLSVQGEDDAGQALLGTKPAEWAFTDWHGAKPLALAGLQGKVVLIRWWTAPYCPYCRASAPALNEFQHEFGDQGLQVIGAYHHKARTPLHLTEVKAFARDLEFRFPIAIDPEWQTLRKWWLNTGDRDFTSVTFLLDRKGVIRHIHPGGQYVKGDQGYRELKAAIRKLVRE